MIDAHLLRYVASTFAYSHRICSFSAPISTEDLEQESALAFLRGRNSIKGPMQDALRKARPMGRSLIASKPKQVSLDSAFYRFKAQRPERSVSRSIDIDRLRFCLNIREFEVVHLLYWQGLSVKEVAERRGVTPARISQIKSKILKTLRETAW